MWTNRKGAEYMWWNNVETKPGTGYPKGWENQEKYKGGWMFSNGRLHLKLGGKKKLFTKIFYNPDQPSMKNYYEPFNFRYEDLISSKDSKHQPMARAYSEITGKEMDITSGPNWDDDLSGSKEYALDDVNLTEAEKKMINELESIYMFYIPRLCNHCLNPACVASCPSGAIYKRGEDGIVLINQEKCKSWRYCVSACPYKKVYYNWNTSKSEKCIFCYPRVENKEATICSRSCVGKIRSIGVILYDLDLFENAMKEVDTDLIDGFKKCILNPFDNKVIKNARKNGINEEWIKAAQVSPIYTYFIELKIALPLHPEFRTFPSIFYVPPLSPVITPHQDTAGLPDAEQLRIPVKYLSKLFAAGNEKVTFDVVKRLLTIRNYLRAKGLGEVEKMEDILSKSDLNKQMIDKAFHLFTQATIEERYAIPNSTIVEGLEPYKMQGSCGIGIMGKAGLRK
jgi:nitrate reductase beta subunit